MFSSVVFDLGRVIYLLQPAQWVSESNLMSLEIRSPRGKFPGNIAPPSRRNFAPHVSFLFKVYTKRFYGGV